MAEPEDQEPGGRGNRPRLHMINAQAQAAEAQRIAARSMQNAAKYMLWSAILAGTSTTITAAVSLIYLFRIAP